MTGGRLGGGAAETLRATVPILAELGIDARWETTGGDAGYYATARALQAALEGAERGPSEEGLARWADMNRLNGKKLDLEADLISVHDSQPGQPRERPERRPVGLALSRRLLRSPGRHLDLVPVSSRISTTPPSSRCRASRAGSTSRCSSFHRRSTRSRSGTAT